MHSIEVGVHGTVERYRPRPAGPDTRQVIRRQGQIVAGQIESQAVGIRTQTCGYRASRLDSARSEKHGRRTCRTLGCTGRLRWYSLRHMPLAIAKGVCVSGVREPHLRSAVRR